jgi:predicted nucleotidyltransferase
MRLNSRQIAAIRHATAKSFGQGAQVWLFGSRVDDSKRGGDIDLMIQPDPACAGDLLQKKIDMLGRLEKLLGERKVDVVVEQPHDNRSIVQIARDTGIRL